jgi:hypothetical protein
MPDFRTVLESPELTGKLLYHYTSQAGLLGITESRTIWASSVFHLNDSAEFSYATKLVAQEIKRRRMGRRIFRQGEYDEFYSKILNMADSLHLPKTFAASFSEAGDCLSQWRAYASDGNGFCLGFRDRYLSELAEWQHFRLVRCIYDEREQREVVNSFLDSTVPIFRKENSSLAGVFFAETLARIAPSLKDPSFKDEREWRLLASGVYYLPDEDVRVRAYKSTMIPYIEFYLELNDISFRIDEIIEGPNPYPQLNSYSVVESKMAKRLWPEPRVRRSRIPHRSL